VFTFLDLIQLFCSIYQVGGQEMSPFNADSRESGELIQSHRDGKSGQRWQVLAFVAILGFTLVVMLLVGLRSAYSDDGTGVDPTVADDGIIWQYPFGDKTLLKTTKSVPGDLLTNGDMDQMGLYWKYPNHYIAGAWYEWFSTRLLIPEYTNGNERGFVHTPANSQRMQKWGASYAGGLMQSAVVTPCTYYRFQAYGHSRPGSQDPPPTYVDSHMKVGIEPNGWWYLEEGKTIPNYPSGFEPENFPPTVVWSPEATHNFVWTPYEVQTEALSNTVTVILYSNPEVNPDGGVWWNDTLWDTASLVEIPWPKETLLDDEAIPAPDGQISNLTANIASNQATIEWDTSVESSTQLLYRAVTLSEPVTGTLLTHALYLPRIDTGIRLVGFQHTLVDTQPVFHHRVVVTGLPAEYVFEFVALSRWLGAGGCFTSASKVARAQSNRALSQEISSVLQGE
jgi:hypothetical protein